jgi:predicted nucleotide-binding protein
MVGRGHVSAWLISLEVLENEVDRADFGVAIAHPDDIVRSTE